MVLLRDGPTGLEVLLTVRPRSMRFMGGAAVFPGGAVASADLDPAWEAASRLDGAEAARRVGVDDPRAALGAYVCALREAYEEVGFVVGSGPIDSLGRADADDAFKFLSECLEAKVVLGTDALVPAGRWVTPIGAPVRFDARFFVAEVPPGWIAAPDPAEVEDCFWISPAGALDRLAAGTLNMAPPTIEMLDHLAASETVAQALTMGTRVGAEGAVLATAVAPGVSLVLAPNPGPMTGPGTNTYVVGGAGGVVIDPATDDGRYLEAVLGAAGGRVGEIVVTHRHPDHVGGVGQLVSLTGAPVRAFGGRDAGGAPVVPVEDGETLEAGPHSLTILHAPGHSSDHICLVLGDSNPSNRTGVKRKGLSLFAGDNLLGEGTAVIAPPDGDMRVYLQTLDRLRALSPRRVFPGHFRPLDDGVAAIDAYISHRWERHSAILAALVEPRTLEELLERVYVDTPEALLPVARFSLQAHLEMAEGDGAVAHRGNRWFRPDTG